MRMYSVLQFCVIFIGSLLCIGCNQCFDKSYNYAIDTSKYPEMDPNTLKALYPSLDVVQINLKSSKYHADCLRSAKTAEECAYHVIAIGLIKEDTPDVRRALVHAVDQFKSVGVPQGYDWPDSAEEYKAFLKKNRGHLHYPGNRMVPMLVLIRECVKRLGIEKLNLDEN